MVGFGTGPFAVCLYFNLRVVHLAMLVGHHGGEIVAGVVLVFDLHVQPVAGTVLRICAEVVEGIHLHPVLVHQG